MPRYRRPTRSEKTHLEDLSQDHIYSLLTGQPLMCATVPLSREDFEIAWEIHSERLMREWLADPERSGTRPFGWWLCEHGKERPVVNEFVPEEQMRKDCIPRGGLIGPHHSRAPYGHLFTHCWNSDGPYQEPEDSYLFRHHLLSEREAREYLLRHFEPGPGIDQAVADYVAGELA